MAVAGARVRVVLVRHGETWWNRAGRLQGQQDTELSDLGLEQARATGRHLRAALPALDAVVSSDLARARVTAETVLRERGAEAPPLRTDARLREIALGKFEGKTARECKGNHETATAWKRFMVDPAFACPGGGESRVDQRRRVAAALDELVLGLETSPPRERVALLVAHGGALACLYQHVAELADDEPGRHCSNCSVSVVEARVEAGKIASWSVLSWDETKHLAEVAEGSALAL